MSEEYYSFDEKGVQSEWIPPSPTELNIPKQIYGTQYSANISNRVTNLE